MPGQNGSSPSEANSAGDGSADAPSLTVGQRLLLKLPDLGRNKPPARSQKAPDAVEKSPQRPVAEKRPTGSRPAPKAQPAEQDEIEDVQEPDEIDHVEDVEVLDHRATQSTRRSSSSASRSSSSSSSSSGSSRPRPVSAYDAVPTSELTVLIRKLDDKERLFAFIAAPLGVVLTIVVTIVAVHTNPALHHKGHESSGIIVTDGSVGVAFALFVLAMAWFRRRSLTAFALLFLGYSVGLVGPGIPFLFLGGYLLYRAWKIQKVLTSRGVNTRPQKRTAARSPRDAKSRRDAPSKATSARPNASKRYTPPKPPPKKPPIAKPEKAAGP